MNKIIFLDVDGVICPYADYQKVNLRNRNNVFSHNTLCYLCLLQTNTDAKIVISSSWRKSERNMNNLIYIFKDYGNMLNNLIGTTPVLYEINTPLSRHQIRGEEINAYITDNNVENYVILDDYNLEPFVDNARFIKCDMHEGLTFQLAEKAIKILNEVKYESNN